VGELRAEKANFRDKQGVVRLQADQFNNQTSGGAGREEVLGLQPLAIC